MSVTSTLRNAIGRGETRAHDNVERYFAVVASLTERTASVLTKLPGGERVADPYIDRVNRVSDAQRKVLLKVIDAQIRLPSWPVRGSAGTDAEQAEDGQAAEA